MSDSGTTTGEGPDEPSPPDQDEAPSTDDLREPSTEKEPGEEPKAPERVDEEPSHEAVGIGIVGRPQVEPETITSAEEE